MSFIATLVLAIVAFYCVFYSITHQGEICQMGYPFLKPEDFESIFSSIKIETYSKSIERLFSLRLLSRIDYKPYYQRNYVWDDHKASYFIESIILGTEIPPLIFFNKGEIWKSLTAGSGSRQSNDLKIINLP